MVSGISVTKRRGKAVLLSVLQVVWGHCEVVEVVDSKRHDRFLDIIGQDSIVGRMRGSGHIPSSWSVTRDVG